MRSSWKSFFSLSLMISVPLTISSDVFARDKKDDLSATPLKTGKSPGSSASTQNATESEDTTKAKVSEDTTLDKAEYTSSISEAGQKNSGEGEKNSGGTKFLDKAKYTASPSEAGKKSSTMSE